jgi:hypothetical protein
MGESAPVLGVTVMRERLDPVCDPEIVKMS